MIISVPVRNQDGSLQFEATLNEKQVQALLQFAMNMAMGMGMLNQLTEVPEAAAVVEGNDNTH